MSDIKLIRLTSGEELIAKTEKIDDVSYILKKPAILIPAGKDQLAFGQWLPYADIEEGIEIPSQFVIFVTDPMDELLNQYNTSFGSGIVIPTRGSVSGPNLKLTT
jgi:hypothetical protein|tara:strand:- start:104 stop:418 length:315 start_codon:yes stop_codon:yes gene_type:complete